MTAYAPTRITDPDVGPVTIRGLTAAELFTLLENVDRCLEVAGTALECDAKDAATLDPRAAVRAALWQHELVLAGVLSPVPSEAHHGDAIRLVDVEGDWTPAAVTRISDAIYDASEKG